MRRLLCTSRVELFATSHGKGPCDGLGGTVKWLAAKASLQRCVEGRNNASILTPETFLNFCTSNIRNIDFAFLLNDDYESEALILKERHESAVIITGTQKLHYLKPILTTSLLLKRYSSADISYTKRVCFPQEASLSEANIDGYVTIAYDDKWWLGHVLDKDSERKEVKVTFLSP